MCGIFAYIGKKNNAANIVLDGLKRLEYRGYDSWGIAVNDDGKISLEKHVGKIGGANTILPKSTLGIGHTRWATHGGVTDANAHPHFDCKRQLAVVHNGIIENFAELKKQLQKTGHKFLSETDTEVAAHLIEKNLETHNFRDAVRLAFNTLKGMNAIIVINTESGEIICVKNGSPIAIGIGEGEYFLASDATGIIPHTRKVIFLEDHQMAILSNIVEILSLPDGHVIKPTVHTLSWKFEDAELGKHKHFFTKEAYEQPHILENISVNAKESTQQLAELIKESYGTFMLACGSASHAGIVGTYLFSRVAKRHINFSIASEFKYIEDYITPKTLVLAISQSGESIDVIEPMMRAKNEKHAKTAAIVNSLGSTLYRMVDLNVMLNCGPEKCVVATKSFTAMVATLLLTAYAAADKNEEGATLLQQAADDIRNILDEPSVANIKAVAKSLKNKENIYSIGRGMSYATALEFALKIKETCCVHAEGLPGGELKHGPIALIEKGTPVVVFAPNDETYYDIVSNAQEIKARGGYIIGIGPKNNPVFDTFLETADIGDATILSQTVITQLLSYYLALERGIPDPDKPRNLAKSVTVK